MAIEGPRGIRSGVPRIQTSGAMGEIAGMNRRGFLVAAFKGALVVGAANLAPGLIGCGGAEGIKCETTVNMVNKDIALQIANKSLMSIIGGTGKFKLELTLAGEDQALSPKAILNVKLFNRNGLMGADADGKLSILDPSQADYSACSADLRSCSPFVDVPGILPVGVPKVNADGAYMFQSADSSIFAALGQMRDRTYANPVYEFNHDLMGLIFVAARRVVDFGSETEKNVWYRVDENGRVVEGTDDIITDEDIKDKQLGPKLSYFSANPDGEYQNTETITLEDGSTMIVPVPDPSLNNVSLQPIPSDTITLKDIYLGKQDQYTGEWIIQPLARTPITDPVTGEVTGYGDIDWSLVELEAKELKYRIKMIDMRPGFSNVKTYTELYSMTIEDSAQDLTIPPEFYSNGQLKAKLVLEFEGDVVTNIAKKAYIYSTMFDARATVKLPQESTDCVE